MSTEQQPSTHKTAFIKERLKIKPDAVLCVRCKARLEQEGS